MTTMLCLCHPRKNITMCYSLDPKKYTLLHNFLYVSVVDIIMYWYVCLHMITVHKKHQRCYCLSCFKEHLCFIAFCEKTSHTCGKLFEKGALVLCLKCCVFWYGWATQLWWKPPPRGCGNTWASVIYEKEVTGVNESHTERQRERERGRLIIQ